MCNPLSRKARLVGLSVFHFCPDIRAGDSVFIEGGKIHEGINKGASPVKAVATFVVEKGKPLTTPAP